MTIWANSRLLTTSTPCSMNWALERHTNEHVYVCMCTTPTPSRLDTMIQVGEESNDQGSNSPEPELISLENQSKSHWPLMGTKTIQCSIAKPWVFPSMHGLCQGVGICCSQHNMQANWHQIQTHTIEKLCSGPVVTLGKKVSKTSYEPIPWPHRHGHEHQVQGATTAKSSCLSY